ncbi:MAG: hypothetical protein AABO41_17810 [Acidobacteriota bacterium]
MNLVFKVDLSGDLKGLAALIGFITGFDGFEDQVWEHLGKQVETQFCNTKAN